jgi:fucose 4-O-acetylase-like acetyltransferase
MFHIAGFFILPVIYGGKQLSWHNISTNAVRLLWPYFLLTILFYFSYYIIYNGNDIDLAKLSKTVFLGHSTQLKQYCGFQILWFLPAMFSLLLLRDIYFSSPKYIRYTLLAFATFMLLQYRFKIVPSLSYWSIAQWGPLQMGIAITYLPIGLATRWIAQRYGDRKFIPILAIIIAIATSILYFTNMPRWGVSTWSWDTGAIFYSIAFFMLLWYFRDKLATNRLLTKFGENSLPVYLFHPFIGFALMAIMPGYLTYPIATKLIIIVATVIAIPAVSLCLSILAKRMTIIYRFFLPNNINEFKQIFSK